MNWLIQHSFGPFTFSVFFHWTVRPRANLNFKCEGQLYNPNRGQKHTQESANTFAEPGVCQGVFPHDLFIWEACGCLLSSADLRRLNGQKSQERCEVVVVCQGPRGWSIVFHSSWFALSVFCQGCWWTSAALFICIPFFFLCLFIQGGLAFFFSMDWISCRHKYASELPNRL